MSHDDISKAAWRKASYCNGATACVEVAPLPDGGVVVRDSKQEDGPVLTFTRTEWTAFVRGVHAHEFDRYGLPAGDGSGVDGAPRVPDGATAVFGGGSVPA